MKKTTRLTALLLALVLLLANLSASATETTEGIPLEDLDMETYSTMLMTASEDSSNADVTVCDTVYCENVLYMLEQCLTAQEKYEYLMTLYTEVPEGETATQEDLVLEYTLLHYAQCHVEDMEDYTTYEVCTCAFPMIEPDSVPGDISMHSEDCPWHFANLLAAEKVEVIEAIETIEEKQTYFALVTDETEKAAMDAIAATGEKIQLITVTDEETGETVYLISSYGMETLATIETGEDGTQYLVDARYHIRVAKVENGLVYPLN